MVWRVDVDKIEVFVACQSLRQCCVGIAFVWRGKLWIVVSLYILGMSAYFVCPVYELEVAVESAPVSITGRGASDATMSGKLK